MCQPIRRRHKIFNTLWNKRTINIPFYKSRINFDEWAIIAYWIYIYLSNKVHFLYFEHKDIQWLNSHKDILCKFIYLSLYIFVLWEK